MGVAYVTKCARLISPRHPIATHATFRPDLHVSNDDRLDTPAVLL